MTKTTRVLFTAALATATALAARPCFAAGFLIYDISGEGLGRASAVTADSTEPATGWYNPANIVFLERVNASVSGVFLTSRSTFSPSGGGPETKSDRGNFVIPAVFANALVTDRVAVGVGVFSTFGLGIKWPYDWEGRQAAIEASLQTITINPNVAVRLHRQVSVAAGFDAFRSVVDFTNGLPTLVGGDVRLVGGTWGYGFNLASIYQVLPSKLHVGVSYRSRATLDFNGRADFSPANPDFGPSLPDQGGTASITLPDIISLGVMGRPRPDLSLTLDANIVLWSTYDRLDINFETAPDRALVPNGRNTVTLRAGADWAVPARPGLRLRGGLIFDRSAITSSHLGPSLPDANRLDFALGAGYSLGRFRADLGYLLVVFLPADATGGEGPAGTYKSIAHLLGLTLGASWR